MRNRILITRNPYRLGNAIVHSRSNKVYRVITDYGNVLNLTYAEVIESYHIHKKANEEHKNYNHG